MEFYSRSYLENYRLIGDGVSLVLLFGMILFFGFLMFNTCIAIWTVKDK